MDPITLSLISAGLNIGGGILGEILGSEDDAAAYRMRKEQLARALNISLPQLDELVAKEQGRTNLSEVTTDPALDAYQQEAQERLADVGRSGGLDAQARARMEQGAMEAAQQERSSREAILNDARMRCTLSSGAELSALVQAGQSAADRNRMASTQALSDAEQRALQAIVGSGQMAAGRQATQFNQRAQVATAQDDIDRFNTATANNFAQFNQQQRQQQFQNQMGLTAFQNNAQQDMVDHHERRAARTREMVGGIGQAAGYGVGALGQYQGMPRTSAPQALPGLGTSAAYSALDPYLTTPNRRVAR